MHRIMSFESLSGRLNAAYTSTMKCRENVHRFALDAEQLSDARWQISLHIAELERLERDVVGLNLTAWERAAAARDEATRRSVIGGDLDRNLRPGGATVLGRDAPVWPSL